MQGVAATRGWSQERPLRIIVKMCICVINLLPEEGPKIFRTAANKIVIILKVRTQGTQRPQGPSAHFCHHVPFCVVTKLGTWAPLKSLHVSL